MVPNVRISSSTLSEGGTESLACIQRTLGEVSLEMEAISRMKRILGVCNWRLTIYEGGYAASNTKQPLQVLTLLLGMTMILAIGQGPGLLLVSPFCVNRIVIINGEGRIRLARAWATTL